MTKLIPLTPHQSAGMMTAPDAEMRARAERVADSTGYPASTDNWLAVYEAALRALAEQAAEAAARARGSTAA